MEEGASLEDIIDDAIHNEATCISLESLDLEDLPGERLLSLTSLNTLKTLNLEYNDLRSLPEEIGLLTSLEELYLTGNQLESLPKGIGELVNLKQLHANENCLTKFPETFCELKCLQVLNIIGNKLLLFQDSLGLGLKSLTELRADENCLQVLPESFTNLSKLRVLELAENKITKLPDNFGNFQELRILNLCQNAVEELPSSFSELGNLQSLDITDNRIQFLPDEFKSAECIQNLYVVNNLVKVLPQWFERLYSIVELNLSDNELNDVPLPTNFGDIAGKTLVSLDLSGNKMTALPDSIGKLQKLETFHLGSTICELERKAFQNGNWLPRLPESFGQMTSLTKLHLDENLLASLPESFGDLRSLEWLDVSQNLIHELPKSFTKLTNLWFFQFSKNSLESLPDDFGNLTNLVELRLDNNNIASLPDSFANLQKIRTVDLFCNRLTEIPKVLLKLKNLTRLDLDGNKFKIKEDKVPKLSTPVQYAPRDPALKGTWRGKMREDKEDIISSSESQLSIKQLFDNAETEGKPDDDDVDGGDEECNYSEKVLEMAMRRGLSIWKSHTGPQTRQDTKQTHDHSPPKESFKFVPQDTAFDIFEDATDETNAPSSMIEHCEVHCDEVQLVSDDWDKEAEDNWQQTYQTKGINFTKKGDVHFRVQLQDILYSYPPAKQAFTRSATYESVYRGSMPGCTDGSIVNTNGNDMMGQFDDADDL